MVAECDEGAPRPLLGRRASRWLAKCNAIATHIFQAFSGVIQLHFDQVAVELHAGFAMFAFITDVGVRHPSGAVVQNDC
jgi:hypothetical protein